MLSLDNLGLDFGGRTLFTGVSLRVNDGERIGFVGRNGMGKSTLLRVISDQQSASRGAVSKQKELRIGYFNQDLLAYESSDSLFEVVATAFGDAYASLKRLNELYMKSADLTEDETNLMYELQEKVEHADAYRIEPEVKKILVGLGFTDEEMDKSYKLFSGGWRMRAMLAKCLLERPNLLMLDEPTNHLDLPAIQWLEGFISRYEGAVIIVSHDKAFIDGSCNKIWELEMQKITEYTGNYTKFEQLKAERLELLIAQQKNQEAWFKEQMRFVERFRSKASKARAVQSRLKLLDKVERIEVEEGSSRSLGFKPMAAERAGREVVKVENLQKSFGERVIFTGADAVLERGDKVALIGPNGQGKSTLLKCIAGNHTFEGGITLGHNVSYSFYAQHQLEDLDPKNTIWDEVTQKTLMTDQEKRNLLGAFLFGGDDITKRVSILSGGERARVAMAIVMAQGNNFLMLDEPTNHLDIPSVEQLAEALQVYNGSLLLVSHDRDFLKEVANKVWFLEDGKIRVFDGTYEEFEEINGKDFWTAKTRTTSAVQKPTESKAATSTTTSSNNSNRNEQKKLEKRQHEIEQLIASIEHDLATTREKLEKACYESNNQKITEYTDHANALDAQLIELMDEWETVCSAINNAG